MMAHDVALCDRAVCSICDAYGDGYASGKASAYFEVRTRLDGGDHARGCGCEPCRLIRDVTAAVCRETAADAKVGNEGMADARGLEPPVCPDVHPRLAGPLLLRPLHPAGATT